MTNYTPRYLLEVEASDGTRRPHLTTDDRAEAETVGAEISLERMVYLTDNVKTPRTRSAVNQAYRAGYWGLESPAQTLEVSEHYVDGVITRMEHQALDKIDRMAAEAEDRARTAWYVPGGPADILRARGAA